jgi:hypothetical protein
MVVYNSIDNLNMDIVDEIYDLMNKILDFQIPKKKQKRIIKVY